MNKKHLNLFPRRTPAVLMLSLGLVAMVGLPVQARDMDKPSPEFQLLEIERPTGAGDAQLVLLAPDGSYRTLEFDHNVAIEVTPAWIEQQAFASGQYHYEVRFTPLASAELSEAIFRARSDGQEIGEPLPELAAHSGTFRINAEGQLFVARAEDKDEVQADAPDSSAVRVDNVFDGDSVIRGSLCVGFDCANDESFIVDTLKLKASNTRLTFIDTSAPGFGFSTGDWQLRANDTSWGGDHFSIDWLGTDANTGDNPVSTPFRVDGSAPSDAIRISNTGRVGFRTATPVLDLHLAISNTPGLRLEQTSAGGFSPQTWDMAGNEANFFVRDVTNGSRLPFRIRPGAPTSSIDIAASGNVGIGTTSPAAKLHVAGGDIRVDGSVYQLSSRALKTDFVRFDPAGLLDLVSKLDLGLWRYLHAPDGGRHFGPAAEDFHAAFGLGSNADSISLADMAGVALGAAQALKKELDERDARIKDLTQRLERLERALQAQSAGTEE